MTEFLEPQGIRFIYAALFLLRPAGLWLPFTVLYCAMVVPLGERRAVFFSLSRVVLFFAKMLYVLVRPLLYCSRFVSWLFTCKKDRRDGEEVDEGLHRQREHNLVVGSDESEKIFLKMLNVLNGVLTAIFFLACLIMK